MQVKIRIRRKPCKPRRMDGFTLLELLVVMVIIGLLAGYVAPKYFAQIGKSETKTAMAQIDALGKALDQYRLDTGCSRRWNFDPACRLNFDPEPGAAC